MVDLSAIYYTIYNSAALYSTVLYSGDFLVFWENTPPLLGSRSWGLYVILYHDWVWYEENKTRGLGLAIFFLSFFFFFRVWEYVSSIYSSKIDQCTVLCSTMA